jgi:hypothetical protein
VIPVAKVRKPKGFDKAVKTPGGVWLKANPKAKRPKALWTPYLGQLEAGFASLCGYAAMLDPTGGTVDHYLSYKNHPSLAYEWTNYRFASAALNQSKRTEDAKVLDPFTVGAGWFEIILPSLQLTLTARVPPGEKARAAHTLKRLKLGNGERIIRWRQHWYCLFETGKLDLKGLRQVAPLVAEAVVRQQRGQRSPSTSAQTCANHLTPRPRRVRKMQASPGKGSA